MCVCAFVVEETVMMEFHQDFNPRLLPTFSLRFQLANTLDKVVSEAKPEVPTVN